MAEEDNKRTTTSFPKLEGSFDFGFPLRIVDWLKFNYPTLIFTLLMLLETVNFASDSSQLANVITSQSKYNAYPFSDQRMRNEYTVEWRVVSRPGQSPLLGMPFPWSGSAYGGPLWAGDNCLTDIYDFWQVYGRSSNKNVHTPDDYSSSQLVCIPFHDVFYEAFTSSMLDRACPNNKTGVFDENSYFRLFSQRYGDFVYSNPSVVGEYKHIGKQIYSLYRPGWEKSVMPMKSCQALFSIYMGTIVIFSFECLIIVTQIIVAVTVLCKPNATPKERVAAIVEFPLIGFVIMHAMLTKDEIALYYEIDKDKANDHDVLGRLLGTHREDNVLFTRVKVSSVIYPIWCKKQEDLPASVTLLQAIFYPIALPWSKNFYKVYGTSCLNLFLLVTLGPLCIAFSMTTFLLNLVLFFVVSVAYADKLYMSRFLHDIPNIAMSISYIVNVQYSATAVFSIAISGILLLKYLLSMAMVAYRECTRREREVVVSTLHEVYGTLTVGQALSITLVQPYIMMFCYILWIPCVFCQLSCVVDKYAPVAPTTVIQVDKA